MQNMDLPSCPCLTPAGARPAQPLSGSTAAVIPSKIPDKVPGRDTSSEQKHYTTRYSSYFFLDRFMKSHLIYCLVSHTSHQCCPLQRIRVSKMKPMNSSTDEPTSI